MKDIQSRASRPLDLSKANEAAMSRHKLDLSSGKKPAGTGAKPTQPRQTNFYEFMPAVATNAPEEDFGDKLADWSEDTRRKVTAGYAKVTAFLMSAVAPMKRYWAVAIGAGLILGLLVISYIASNRDWVTSFPANIFALPTSGKDQGDNGKNNSQPGKSAGAAAQTPTPETAEAARAAETPGAGVASPVAGTSSGGATQLPVSGVVPGSGGTPYSVPATGGTTGGSAGTVTTIVQQAPVVGSEPAHAPAPILVPSLAPTPAPAPLPLPSTAPLLKTIEDTAAPVTDTLL